MDKVLPSLDESEPVHGDLDTVLYLTDVHKVILHQNLTYIVYLYCVCIALTLLPSVHFIARSVSMIFLAFAVFSKYLYNSPRGFFKISNCESNHKFLPQLRDFGAQALPSKYLEICVVYSSTQAFQKELGSYQRSVDAATASGNHLVAEVLDDPTVTQQDLGEMNEMWEEVCVKSVQKQERLNKAQEVCNLNFIPFLHVFCEYNVTVIKLKV